jgi:hypothetical protein
MPANNILVPGFRKGLSTENAGFKLTDNVLKPIKQKMHVEGILCDVARNIVGYIAFFRHSRNCSKLG